jgi:DNA-binding FadR family transcriptional regulator
MNIHERQKPRMNRFHDVVEKIQEWIAQGKYVPGERLPAERKLAIDMQVSRTSIREAYLILEHKDLVEIRWGVKGGAYVKTRSSRLLAEEIEFLLRIDKLTLDQVAEFREAIEKSVTSIAAQKADSKDIRLLKYLLEDVSSFIGKGSGWVDGFIEADKALHISIAQISENPLVSKALEATFGLDRYFNRFLNLSPALMEENLNDLRDMVEAIENHQPETAGRICHSHITRFNNAAV